MEEISVKGENYVKASLLAKKFGYTQDYIGQLCRSEQVKATLLGRSWYVNEESLIKHRQGRYRSNLSKSKELVRKVTEERSREPLHTLNARRLVRYESDESALLPGIEAKDNSDSRDNSENTAKNNDFSDKKISPEESRPIIKITHSPRPSRPTVRTIPAFSPAKEAVRQGKERQAVVMAARPHSRPVMALLVVLAVLAGEIGLILTSLGMEKKLLTAEDGTDMVLYNFDPKLVANSFQILVSK